MDEPAREAESSQEPEIGAPPEPLHVFVDESYRDDLYLLVAVVVSAEQLALLERGLDDVVARTGKTWGWPPKTELHAVDIFQHKGAFTALEGKLDEKTRLFEKAYWRIDEADATLIVVNLTATGWARHRKVARDHQRFIAMEQLVERVGALAQEANTTAIVLFDTEEQTDWAVAKCFNDLHELQTTAGTAWLDRPAEAADSAVHRGLQAADLVAYIEMRHSLIARGLDAPSVIVHRAVARLEGFLIQRILKRHLRDGVLRIHWR